jgi:hypothetical protein
MMPSIFIWKSEVLNTSKKNIRCYIGSNWTLEDNEYSSKSYMYLEQIVIPGFNDSVITFHTKNMPQDWVGSDLLEVTNIPYEFVKSDNYGTLEKVGEWMRFTHKGEISFNSESLISELEKIKKWMNMQKYETPSKSQEYNKHHNNNYKNKPQNEINPARVHLDFQEFLIKYSLPQQPDKVSVSTTTQININNNSQHRNNYNKNTNYSHNKYKKTANFK